MFPLGGDLASAVQQLAIAIPALLLALSFHEFSHAWLAVRLGDDTPHHDGRVTMNPIAHLDPIGALMLVFAGFGWARPVQVHGQNFKNPLRDMALVAIAGPVSNLLLGFVSALALRLMIETGALHGPIFEPIFRMLQASLVMNVGLAVFNLLPIPPLDGSRLVPWLFPSGVAELFARIEPIAPILLFVLLFTPVLGPIIWPIARAVREAILWGAGL